LEVLGRDHRRHPTTPVPVPPIWEDRDVTRLVLVHGFTQTARSWDRLASRLAEAREVVALDAPGHGAHAAERADLWQGADRLVDEGGPGTYVGYSMGARFCLHAALAHPDQVEGLVLMSGTAGLRSDEQRAARRASDAELGARIAEQGVKRFVDEWLALPLFAGLSPAAAGREHRLTNMADGLRSSLELAGTGAQEPLWDRLAELAMPVLVVAGADDPKFTALAHELAAGIGRNAELAVIEEAGHTVHLEQPDQFTATLEHWLTRHDL
jgi:2-succinyl-6-hydroxy-2,4-cyclohexadiene-1-carboxylate synthase